MTEKSKMPSQEQITKWRALAERGDAVAQLNVGLMYLKGQGVEQSDEKAFEWFKKSANGRNEQAQFNVGLMYHKGQGVEQSYEKAFEWYKKSADNGNAQAQLNVGVMYRKGEGVEQSDEKAFEWFKKSADNGNADAQFNVGVMYRKGEVVEQSDEEAFEWFKKSADNGNADAQFNVGVMYRKGEVVEQSDEEAFEWFKKSADNGNADAQFNVGLMYAKGQGVKQSDEEAFEWFKKCAEQGNATAQFIMGLMYNEGRGTGQNYEKAIAYYRQSFNGGLNVQQFELNLSPLAEITKKTHDILKDLEITRKDVDIQTVTHFTSFNVYEEIFNNENGIQPLHMSNVDGCNDPDEGKVLFEQLRAGENTPHIDSYPLITSFCRDTPENLPMWHMYADDAKGVALVLDTYCLLPEEQLDIKNSLVILDSNKEGQHATQTRLFRVFYIKREGLKRKPKNISENLNSETSKDLKILKKLYDLKVEINKIKSKHSNLKKYVYKILIELAHVIKYDDYKYEQEIRLVRFAFKSDIKKTDNPLKSCKYSQRVYMDAPQIAYKKIVTAPKMEERQYRYVKYLADRHDIITEPSKIRYR